MTEVRAEDGRFVGMCDVVFPYDRSSWRLPVVPPLSVTWEPSVLPPPSFEAVELARARWREADGQIREVYRVSDRDAAKLEHVRHVYLAGATCETNYGKALKLAEAVSLIGVLRFHRMVPNGITH